MSITSMGGSIVDAPVIGGAAPVAEGADSGQPMPWLNETPRSAKGGKNDAAIKQLQTMLREAGFDPGPSDGWFGPKTAAAVRKYQKARNLVVDANVGPQTWGALGKKGAPRTKGPEGPVDTVKPPKPGAPSQLTLPGAPPPTPTAEEEEDAPVPEGHPHERRESWFLSQQPGPYNPNEDVQGNGNCGPSAVTMIARAFGKVECTAEGVDEAVEETRRRIGESMDEKQGTSIAGLVRALNSYDMNAQVIHNVTDVSKIEAELAKGRLVIAHVKATYLRPNPRSGHYTVVTAIKDGMVYLNDSSNKSGPMAISIDAFMQGVRARGTYTIISAAPNG